MYLESSILRWISFFTSYFFQPIPPHISQSFCLLYHTEKKENYAFLLKVTDIDIKISLA